MTLIVIGSILVALAFVGLGIIATRNEIRRDGVTPSWSGDRHGKGRAYARNELIKTVVTKP